MLASVCTEAGFSNLKKVCSRTRIQNLWNRSWVGVWKCDCDRLRFKHGRRFLRREPTFDLGDLVLFAFSSVRFAGDPKGSVSGWFSRSVKTGWEKDFFKSECRSAACDGSGGAGTVCERSMTSVERIHVRPTCCSTDRCETHVGGMVKLPSKREIRGHRVTEEKKLFE